MTAAFLPISTENRIDLTRSINMEAPFSMATVSILVPAYKAQYLTRAIASAVNQTFTDVEILVGDDTPDAALASIVKGIDDPRIRYFHHGFQRGTLNFRALHERAEGKYIKWLFDDDLLMERSVETLVAALEANPDAPMAFHERVVIDANDNVTFVPPSLLQAGLTARLDRQFLVQHMISQLNNFVGEPSNIMLNRDLVAPGDLFNYRSWRLDFLGDVALYLNLAELAPIVAVGGYLSTFRQHADQCSNQASPNFSAGLYEWEMMVRGEASTGKLTRPMLGEARQKLRHLYAPFTRNLPEIARLAANLDELVEKDPLDLLETEQFKRDFSHARHAVATRRAARRDGVAALQQKTCAICEQPVQDWLPHPAANQNRDFMQQVESVGSTLQNHLCPRCHCNDRERHLWLYFGRAGLLEKLPQMRVLHIAPEAGVERKIRALQPREYFGGDLAPKQPHHIKINVEQIEFPDDYFDLIICNHVLEHVDRPGIALSEFYRCLVPGGHLVAQTPYSPLLKQTFELNRLPAEPFADRYFGQNDHVRLFGSDISKYFEAAGFNGDTYPHISVLDDLDPDVWGCNPREPFFLFAKGSAPQFPR
jgi:glycosyltransferase involved in cell wall biosynthesis